MIHMLFSEYMSPHYTTMFANGPSVYAESDAGLKL